MNENKSKTKYFFLEVSEQDLELLSKGCKTMEALMCGNLDAVKQMAFDAYEYRTGCAVPSAMQHQIIDCIAGLESWGWNRPIEQTERFNEVSDTYRDMYEIIDTQQAILEEPDKKHLSPAHYNKNIPQIRVISVYENIKKRLNGLNLFVNKIASKRVR